ncbi:MAG: hypothetical protein KJ822_17575 [Proteobacteria bacterium]|nr:hypothetical protein [Pseudomonadota bacterium]
MTNQPPDEKLLPPDLDTGEIGITANELQVLQEAEANGEILLPAMYHGAPMPVKAGGYDGAEMLLPAGVV